MITIKALGLCEWPTPVSCFRLAGSLWDIDNLKRASLHTPPDRMPQRLLLQGQIWGMCSPERSPIHMLTDKAWRTQAEIDKKAGPSRVSANASLKLMPGGRGGLSRTRNGGKGLPILATVTINAEQHFHSTNIIGPSLFCWGHLRRTPGTADARSAIDAASGLDERNGTW